MQQNGTHSTTTSAVQEGANDSTYVSPISSMPTSTSYDYEYRVAPKKYENEINKVQLPKKGDFSYVIPKKHREPKLPTEKIGDQKGYLNNDYNIWLKGPCHAFNCKDPFEWDVQLSNKGKNNLKHLIGDAEYVNVSIDGSIRTIKPKVNKNDKTFTERRDC